MEWAGASFSDTFMPNRLCVCLPARTRLYGALYGALYGRLARFDLNGVQPVIGQFKVTHTGRFTVDGSRLTVDG